MDANHYISSNIFNHVATGDGKQFFQLTANLVIQLLYLSTEISMYYIYKTDRWVIGHVHTLITYTSIGGRPPIGGLIGVSPRSASELKK